MLRFILGKAIFQHSVDLVQIYPRVCGVDSSINVSSHSLNSITTSVVPFAWGSKKFRGPEVCWYPCWQGSEHWVNKSCGDHRVNSLREVGLVTASHFCT